jgi:hypothetical protein
MYVGGSSKEGFDRAESGEGVGRKPMQGGEPDPGRGVYVARRIVAAFILLLLLVLLVPWACQALFPERDSGPKAPETAVTDEDTATEQASAPDNSSDGDEVDEGNTGRATSTLEADGDESSEVPNVEVAVDLTGVITGLEADASEGGIVDSAPLPAPVPSTDNQQVQPIPQETVQPIPQETVLPVAQHQQQAAQPSPQQQVQPITQQVQPVAFEEPIFFREPPLFERPAFFGEPVFFEGPYVFEEPIPLGEGANFESPPAGTTAAPTASDAPVLADSGGPVAVTGTVVASA